MRESPPAPLPERVWAPRRRSPTPPRSRNRRPSRAWPPKPSCSPAGSKRRPLIDTTNNRAYDLASARLLIGRESKNDIAVHDVNASRTHAELRFEPQGVWTITDLGSTNGTLVNGREVATQPLSEGDRITIGMTNFMFTQA